MSDAVAETSLAALLRRAGHAPPPSSLAGLEQGHALLRVVLARIGAQRPDAEPATIFRPAAAP
jgi:hypothetical protein